MRFFQGCVTLILLGITVCEGTPYCRRRQSYAEIGRRCTKPCKSDVDCTARNEKCRCDGACGMSCFNPNANCAELEPLANGSRIVTTRIMGGKVYYRCNTGYVLKGSRRRTCNADKNWHPSAPTCEDYNNFGQTGGNRNVRAAPCLGRIVRGCPAKNATTWPSFVLITRKKSTPTKSLHDQNIVGGGSIINKLWILTAAHVLQGATLTDFVVFVGLWERPSRKKPLDSFVQIYSIAKYVEHPLFNDAAYLDNDIALFKLGRKLDERMEPTTTSVDEGLTFEPRIRAISLPGCLTNGSEYNRTQLHCSWNGEVVSNAEDSAIVVGFGHTKAAPFSEEINEQNIKPPKRLQQATVTIVNRSLCQRELELGRTQVNIPRLQFTDNMLCYGTGPRRRTDACKGDSGGPLMEKVFDEQTKTLHWVQIGIVSFGIGCASNYSGYYTKVERYTSWIQNVLSEESSEPASRIRLVDGEGINSGRVEVLHNGIWGSICDHNWDNNDGNVVCRMMGYSGAMSAPPAAHFGPGVGIIWLDEVECNGSESDIISCSKREWETHDCSHYEDASVICEPRVRLVGGTRSNMGRVEVQHLGEWGTVCDDDWDLNDARVICRMLGFSAASSAPKGAAFGQGSGEIWLDNVICLGSETDIGQCQARNWEGHNCNHGEDASVICETGVRLVGGTRSNSGRVEVQHLGAWGTVCDNDWDLNDARVICRMLGFSGASSAPMGAAFGRGSGVIWLDNVICSGSETDIDQCQTSNWGEHNCRHGEDASVICETGVRLVGGTGSNSGRVEIQHLGEWGTVCDDDWDLNDARVICRMLGFSGASSAPTEATFGRGSGGIWLDNVVCSGSETDIGQCQASNWGEHNCNHDEDASVICI